MDSPAGVRLHVLSLQQDANSRRVAIRLASTPRKRVIRITGGCAGMAQDGIEDMYNMFTAAFAGYNGAVVAGGTRMVSALGVTIHGVTEVLPRIARICPAARTIGVTPLLTDLTLLPQVGLIISNLNPKFVTIVHPELQVCLLLQYSADTPLRSWDKEWQACLDYIELLRNDGGFGSGHIFFNGGKYTEHELQHVAGRPENPENPWRMFLVADSGRITSQYAADIAFCRAHADRVVVCGKAELPAALREYGFTNPIIEGEPQ